MAVKFSAFSQWIDSNASFTSRPRRQANSDVSPDRHLRTRLGIEWLEDRVLPSFFPSTADTIGVFEDQLPDGLSNAMTQFLATHTDGTQKILLDQAEQLRAYNPNFTVLQYQLGTGNSPDDYIIDDQWSSDWDYVTSQEGWFVHQTDSGEPQSASDLTSGRVGDSTGWDQADISNPAWQQYTLSQVFQNMAATGSNGWFADSFTYGIGAAGYDGTIPTRYQNTNASDSADWPNGVDWTTQLANWAQTIETAFAQYNQANGTSYVFIPNLGPLVTSWMPNWYDNAQGVPFIDGAFLEDFGEWTDTYDWTYSMNEGLNFTTNNKIVIVQPYPSSDPSTAAGQQQVDFFLGTYLLLKGDQTYINIDYNGGAQYYPEYQLNLGAPTTPPPSNVSSYLWDGVYRRDFQNGFVLVNPGSTSYTLNLGGNYQQVIASGGGEMSDSDISANGNYIGGSMTYLSTDSVTLAGGTAAIFLYPSASGSGPTVATPARAVSSTVLGVAVALSVLGQENGTDSGLTYTWSGAGPAGVTFSVNGTNAAKYTTGVFTQSGTYTLMATISDGTLSVTSSVTVTVKPTLTYLQVSPSSATVDERATQAFAATALDQFGNPLAKQPALTWSRAVKGVGSINQHGVYRAPSHKTGTATVRVHSGHVSATVDITVVANTPSVYFAAATAPTDSKPVAARFDASPANRSLTFWDALWQQMLAELSNRMGKKQAGGS